MIKIIDERIGVNVDDNYNINLWACTGDLLFTNSEHVINRYSKGTVSNISVS